MAQRLIRIPRNASYAFWLGRETYTTTWPNAEMIDVRPQAVAEPHPGQPGVLYVTRRQFILGKHLPPTISWRYIYERWHVHDPDRVPDVRVSTTTTLNGQQVAQILVNGGIGDAAHDDRVISATAGLSVAVLEAAAAVQSTLSLAQQAAQDAAEAAAAAEAVLASGPVTSVNGRQGVVVLGLSGIAGLVSALASKADGTHGHTIAQVSNLQATLNAIADGGAH